MKVKGKRFLAGLLGLAMSLGILLGAGVPDVSAASDSMYIGAGIGDITGPVTEISTGYNSLGDLMSGVLMKLYARAFIAADSKDAGANSRVCYVSAEIVHMTESIKPGVIKELKARGLGDLYNESNVMLAATHCHSSASNTSWYALYDLVNGVPGFDDLYYNIVVDGIADAIENAHNSLKPGSISINSGNISNAVYNRSLEGYSWNIDAENYPETLNTEMTLLAFRGADGSDVGELNWFGSHGTSNGITNRLISADHKGYAAYTFEQEMGNGFVAAFAQNESGDASPNQPQADDVTLNFLRPVDMDPSLNVIENEVVHGSKELNKAKELYSSANTTLSNTVSSVYTNIDFSNISVDSSYIGDYHMPYDDIENASTSVPCIGAAIMAGDEEGAPVDWAEEGEVKHTYSLDEETGEYVRSEFEFTDLQLKGLEYVLGALWPTAMQIIGSDQYYEDQMEKVVCLPVDKLMQTVQQLQILRIGEFAIVGVPFELTSMQARRTTAVLENTLAAAGVTKVVFSTLTNGYSQYVTTREEFAAQNYEGSTCLFGPWSGAALTQELDKLAMNIVNGTSADIGTPAPVISNNLVMKTHYAQTGVVIDKGSFGNVVTQANDSYSIGETVSVTFQSAALRNVPQCRTNGKLDKFFPNGFNYFEIQKQNADGTWTTVRTESDPYTTITWQRDGSDVSTKSTVTIQWLLKDNPEAGTYRIQYNGVAKVRLAINAYKAYTGTSNTFVIK